MNKRFNKIKKLRLICNAFAAYLIYVFMRLFFRKYVNLNDVILFGSGSGYIENNLNTYLQYLIANYSQDYKLYFVSENEKHNSINKTVRNVEIGSIGGYLLALRAKYLVHDCDNSDIAPGIWRLLSGKKLYVNHGSEGIKRLADNYYAKVFSDAYICASDFESEIRVEYMGGDKSKMHVTGYPRHDQFSTAKINSHYSSRDEDILCFFTWRDWSCYPSGRIENYIENFKNIINEDVSFALGSRRIFIKTHHQVCDLIESRFDNIIVLNSMDNLTDYVYSCGSLVTDFSSVSWDFIYQNKPICFFIYDYDEYINEIGTYIDIERDFHSKVIWTKEDFLKFIKFGCRPIERSKYFKFQDLDNSKRVYELMISL